MNDIVQKMINEPGQIYVQTKSQLSELVSQRVSKLANNVYTK